MSCQHTQSSVCYTCATQTLNQVYGQQAILNASNQMSGIYSWFPRTTNNKNYSVEEEAFLNLIDGRTDVEIAETMMTKLDALKLIHLNDFLSLCKRFRPTITMELFEKVSKLKAFI